MRNFWKGVGSAAAVALGVKAIAELIECCRDGRNNHNPKTTVDFTGAKYIPNQLIVWKRPGVSDKDFLEWKRNNKPQGVRQIKLCQYCDDSLELWEGDNISTFISGKGATQGNSAGGGGTTGGGDDIVCYSYNLIIDLPEADLCAPEQDTRQIELPSQTESSEAPVIIAVFDTGLDPLIKKAYTNQVHSCMPGGDVGWNFFDKNADTYDDHPSRHGSRVSKFIIDQANKYKNQKINILPVKIHNKFGKSDLFSVLCGFAYAANCGAKIVNASFGFYAAENSGPPVVLTEFVKKHLTDKNIILVAAAGNLNSDKSLTISELETVRNLDVNPFFPACLSKKFANVIAVTTASLTKNAVSPSQNFSNTIVDIGVKCDKEIKDDYRFEDPLGQPGSSGEATYILGSSFAAPVVTGMIAQFYPEVINSLVNGSINKANLIKKLQELNPVLITAENNPIKNFIKDGSCCAK